jgi:hypothetical protein
MQKNSEKFTKIQESSESIAALFSSKNSQIMHKNSLNVHSIPKMQKKLKNAENSS